ncbi:MAG: hypothetical protein WCD89_06840 [Anaerocolumna sp.]
MNNYYLKALKQISIFKTLLFNIYYFGLAAMIRNGPYCFVSKNVKLLCLKGEVKVNNPKKHRILLGFGFDTSFVDRPYERFIWHNTGTVVFNGYGEIRLASRIDNSGILEFGENIVCNSFMTIICHKKIYLGNNCGISWRTLLMDTDYHDILDETGKVINPDKEIIIRDHVWIGCNVTILKGTDINSQSIIAAGAVLSGKKITEQNVIIGSNGKIIKRNIYWKAE